MRVLITNSTLAVRGGTEAYVQDLAVALAKSGHEVVAYSNVLGETAVDLHAAGITAVSELDRVPWLPDVIHGHHHLEVMTALLHFPTVPAVFVSHGWTKWLAEGIRHPRVLRYVAVDGPTRDALITRDGIPADRIRLIPNFVDCRRFVARGPLPARPRRALVFSHYAREDSYIPMVRDACRRRSIALDVMGYGVGKPVRRPETILGGYDLVFAKGRAALESLVSGCAVIACDAFGLGPMVTTTNFAELRTLEGRYLQWFSSMSVDGLVREIDRYDPKDLAVLIPTVRADANADRAARQLVEFYAEAVAEWARMIPDPAAESRAAASYVRWVSLSVKERFVERDALAGFAVGLRNRLARIRWLAPVLARLSAKMRRRWRHG